METIHHEENKNGGTFFRKLNEQKIAELNYRNTSVNEIIIDHTHVSPVLKGQGVGKLLVEEAVNWAREKKIKIIPQCSFAKAVIDKDVSLQDVLNKKVVD